jgi:hypothetical protein
MARDKKDAWSRFRDKEDQREDQMRDDINKALGEDPNDQSSRIKDGQKVNREMRDKSEEKSPLLRMLSRADLQLEQIQHLYNMYVAGVERTPPHSQRKQIDELFFKMMGVPKNNQTLLFRFNQFQTKFNTYKDRWERLMRDIESGKVIVRKVEK